MITINGTNCNFSNLPNLERLIIHSDNIESVKKLVFDELESLRYILYIMSWVKNNFSPITDISDIIDRKYGKMIKLCSEKTIAKNLAEHKNTAKNDLKEFLEINQTKFSFLDIFERMLGTERIAELKESTYDSEADMAYDVLLNREISWDFIADKKEYNEMENPSIIAWYLKTIFKNTAGENKTKYLLSMYDFGDFSVEFLDEDTADCFAESVVECGTMFSRCEDDNSWVESYRV